ncbi:MAG: ABC transporter ATP-binding protein [Burkholderiales bacterium]|nr:ABC transporter ATP-binding protein [Burkholderiales bacterium]
MLGILSTNAITLSVPGRVLCCDLSFTVAPGQIWAILGANGSGKTTLIHALSGLGPCERGTVLLNGEPLASGNSRQRAREIGVLLQQEDAVFWGSVLEYVLLGRFPHARSWLGWSSEDEQAASAAIDEVGLAGFASRRYTTLSGGERQRARIAQILAQAPRLFLLDEPLQHLDLRHQSAVLNLFQRLARDQGRAVMMVLHDTLWPGRFCTHALLIHDDGTVRAGAASEVLDRDSLERLYGCRLQEFAQGAGRYFLPDV